MKNMSFEEIRSQTAEGNPLPLLRWGQYNSPEFHIRELCKVYRRLYINEQRTYRALGVMPYDERPQWHRDLIEKVSLHNSDINNVMRLVLNDMSDKERNIINLKYCALRLTTTGLAAFHVETETPFYCSNTGEFRRYMSREEWNHVFGLPVVGFPFAGIKVQLPEKWRFLWSWKVSDYTEYKEGTSSNGGDYAFYETHNIFGRMNSGKLELLEVIRHTTSAEFSYDEANASFQSGLGKVTFLDCEDADFCLYAQTSYGEDEVWSLNQVGKEISVGEAVCCDDWEIHEETDRDSYFRFLSYEEKLQRHQILKDVLGWEPTKRR